MSRRRAAAFLLLTALFGSLAASAQDPNPPSIHSERGAWPLRRQWTVPETQHFAEWVAHIYRIKTQGTPEQRRAKLERVLEDPAINLLLEPAFAGEEANPQLPEHVMRSLHGVLDCGKLTVALSSYYAYRRGLPWMIGRVRSGGGDIRTARANLPAGSLNCLESDSVEAFFLDAVTGFSTGNFRVELGAPNAVLSDTVPVAIDRRYLRPGCLHYLDGHVLMLAEVMPLGELRFLDATTAASRDIYSFNGMNAVTGIPRKHSENAGHEYDGCFQGLRVFRYPIAEVGKDGEVRRVRRRTDEEMKQFGFSLEQYDRMEEIATTQRIMSAAPCAACSQDGVPLESFHELILWRLRDAATAAPVAFLRARAEELLASCVAREARVQEVWRDIQAKGPVAFPKGESGGALFADAGRWGATSSLAEDIAFRRRYQQIADAIENMIRWYDRKPEWVDLAGLEGYFIDNRDDVARSLVWEKDRIFKAMKFEYANCAGQRVPLSLWDIEQRLYDLSFDPNHPPELRWGAAPDSAEASSMRPMDTPTPGGKGRLPMAEAYRREAYYRALTREEAPESAFDETSLDGFYRQGKFDDRLGLWASNPSTIPPLMPSRRVK